MSSHILAIDQGTSSTKTIICDGKGAVLASATVPLKSAYGPDGTAEQDPEDIFTSVIDAVASVVEIFEAERNISRTEIECVGIANQRETFVLWDKSGIPLHNAVLWQCKRSVEICNELKEAGTEHEVRERSGLIIDPYFSGTKVSWLRRHSKKISAAHERGEIWFGTVDSWLLNRLTDGAVHATDHTNASRTMMLNIKSLKWDPELTRILEIPNIRLPAVYPSAYDYGASDFSGIFREPVPITALIGDSHASFFGGRCFTPGSAKATLGTGCSILLNAGDATPPSYPTTMTTVGYSLPGRTDYALEGIIVSAGAVLTWLQRELGLYDDPSELESIAEALEDSGGVTVVPGHAGLGAPFWTMDARGSIHGLTFGSNKSHILRGALESIAFQIRAIFDAITGESGIKCSSLRVDGGISKNGFVTQWIADTLGVPVNIFSLPNITAQGAALLAGIGAGVYAGIKEVAALKQDESRIEPGKNRTRALLAYKTWHDVVSEVLRTNQ